ncbi:MAG: leucyl/phenylalanyl-tRNA--protein transferase [Desulfobacterales bacterium]
MPVFYLSDKHQFPPPYLAEEGGLLAVGGDLEKDRLLAAYENGIFPWYMEGEPILWWSPDPRLVLYLHEFTPSKSLRKIVREKKFHVTMDTAFEDVIHSCAEIRSFTRSQTWITDDMMTAYIHLHREGYAHSVEAWYDDQLSGGLYGVSLGRSFFGESMFTRVSNASKVAFYHLVAFLKALDFSMIDCQIPTAHLKRFGAREIPRKLFLQQLQKSLQSPTLKGRWIRPSSSRRFQP